MNSSDAQSKTESSENSSRRDAETSPPNSSSEAGGATAISLPFGSRLALDTIQSLARKIGGQTEGEAHEWAREIERLAWQLIVSYEKQSHRLEEWARGIGPSAPPLDRNRPS
jgi:hypothetical protein